MNKGMLSIDPRVSLCYILFSSLLLMIPFQPIIQYSFLAIVALMLLLVGKYKQLIVYGGLLLIFQVNFVFSNTILQVIIDFLAIGISRLLPLLMTMSLAMNRQSIGQWQTALLKLKVPVFLIIPLIVCIRFIPTLLFEAKQIWQSLKYRGLAQNKRSILRHPWRFFEYFVIPLLSSSEQVIMDLSSSSLLRGIQSFHAKTSIYPLKLSLTDYLWFGLAILLLGGQLWIH